VFPGARLEGAGRWRGVTRRRAWDRGLTVAADGDGLAGHAGGVILREMADRSGLTSALKDALAREGKFPEVDRGSPLCRRR
jgi:hypothetical protein